MFKALAVQLEVLDLLVQPALQVLLEHLVFKELLAQLVVPALSDLPELQVLPDLSVQLVPLE